jgi:predicted transglutaminase-like cysteine proteinase
MPRLAKSWLPSVAPIRAVTTVTGIALIFALMAQGIGELGFTTKVSERLIESYSQRFRGQSSQGGQTRQRLELWKRYAQENRGMASRGSAREVELLTSVNHFLNRIPFIDDLKHWGAEDYWATPAESVESNGADCEDFSVAKYFLLKELGIPVSKLRLVYVKALKLNQAHMVVVYYSTPSAEPLVLDNLEDTVRPASQRTDLVPVYSFNDEEVWVEARGRIGSPRQIRNWSALLERLEAEARQ